MSDTPRTDQAEASALEVGQWHLAKLSRELERENAALRKGEWKARYWEKLEAENAALKQTINAQMQHQRELRADRDRLDWLLTYEGRTWFFQKLDSGGWIKSIGSVRGFIDAAMEKEAQP